MFTSTLKIATRLVRSCANVRATCARRRVWLTGGTASAVGLIASFAASAGSVSSPHVGPERHSQRPTVAHAPMCRLSLPRKISPALGPGLGPGPVYPIMNSTFILEYPPSTGPFAGTGWGGEKVLWVAPRSYIGPITIRGRQIGGPAEVRFGLTSRQLDPALVFKAGSTIARSRGAEQWRQFPTYVRLKAAGCYAFTVTGSTFTRRIYFRVKTVRP